MYEMQNYIKVNEIINGKEEITRKRSASTSFFVYQIITTGTLGSCLKGEHNVKDTYN